MWHVSSRSGVATLQTAIHLLLTYLPQVHVISERQSKQKLANCICEYYSVTEMLLALGLSSFDTVIHNYRKSFLYVLSNRSNDLVKLLRCVNPSAFLWLLLCFIVHFSTYSVCLSVCLCVFVYGPCCLIQIKWWWWCISQEDHTSPHMANECDDNRIAFLRGTKSNEIVCIRMHRSHQSVQFVVLFCRY